MQVRVGWVAAEAVHEERTAAKEVNVSKAARRHREQEATFLCQERWPLPWVCGRASTRTQVYQSE